MLGQTKMARYDKSCWETAKREIKEEIGIELQNGKYPIYVGERVRYWFFTNCFFRSTYFKRTIKLYCFKLGRRSYKSSF